MKTNGHAQSFLGALKRALSLLLLTFVMAALTQSAMSVTITNQFLPASSNTQSTINSPPPLSGYITSAKDLANIVFFIIAGVVAILSYLQARKTLFAPIKTETFKLQLKAFEDVLVFFERHPSMHIDDEFDFDKIVSLNTMRMFDSYAHCFFKEQFSKEVNQEKRKERFKDLVGAIISEDFMQKNCELVEDHIKSSDQKSDDDPIEPALILAKWQGYQHGMVEFTSKFRDASERLRRFRVSPLLPSELKSLIADFEKEVQKNLHLVGEVLTEVAKEMPEKYPTFEKLKQSGLTWIWNKFNHKRTRLQDKQENILKFMENYLQIDNLLEAKNSRRQ